MHSTCFENFCASFSGDVSSEMVAQNDFVLVITQQFTDKNLWLTESLRNILMWDMQGWMQEQMLCIIFVIEVILAIFAHFWNQAVC